MIDKNFYLENLTAFDILIKDERAKAEEVIFRVYCILQRDKIWLNEVATAEEIFEEDAELLEEVEAELTALDEEYDFRFGEFYKLMQQEMKKRSGAEVEAKFEDENEVAVKDEPEIEMNKGFDLNNKEENIDSEETHSDFDLNNIDNDFDNEDEFDVMDEDYLDDDDGENENAYTHLSDEDIDLVSDYILASAKKRFDFLALLNAFAGADEMTVEELFIFPVIDGKAQEESDLEIAERMHQTFTELNYDVEIEELTELINAHASKLGKEILAFTIASDSLQQGASPQQVMEQIAQILG